LLRNGTDPLKIGAQPSRILLFCFQNAFPHKKKALTQKSIHSPGCMTFWLNAQLPPAYFNHV
ncbi:MAG: hypothetical protein ACFB2W_12840, partial [Leptolyngbyaceae cyanobacterium]